MDKVTDKITDKVTVNIIDKAFDGFKKFTPALIAIMIFTGLILFLPETVLEKMALYDLPDIWKNIIGLSFLLCIIKKRLKNTETVPQISIAIEEIKAIIPK